MRYPPILQCVIHGWTLVKESFKHLQPILTQVADRCINQIAATSPPAASDHIFEVEKAKKELIGLLVHIGSKPTEKMLLKLKKFRIANLKKGGY